MIFISQSFSNLPGHRSRHGRVIQRGGRQLAGYEGGGGQARYGGGECDDTGGGGGDGGDGVDFAACQEDPETGFCCVEKIECVDSLGNISLYQNIVKTFII